MRSEKSLQILRRVHTNSEDNIQLPRSSSLFKCRRVRLNTIQNEEELTLKRSDTQKNTGKQLQPLLQPPKYYQSRLVLSCESWSVYNLRQKKYKRGWRPIKIVNFNGFLSLVILKIFYELEQSHPWVTTVTIKVNRFLLKQQEADRCKPLVEQFKLKTQKQKQPDPYLLAENTIISLKDMLVGNLFTNYDDFSQYSAIFMGAIIRDIRQHNDSINKIYQFKQPDLEQGKLLQKQAVIQTFIDYVNSWLKWSQYPSSNLSKACQFYSCPDQITRIFASLLSTHPQFQKLVSRRQTILPIKYQMGYRFYQDRKLKITHEWPCIKDHLIVKSKNKFNFVVASFNKATQNVIALYDCKYNMEDIDLMRIEDFLLNLSKPIVQKKDKPSSTVKLPILKISE